MITHWLPSAGKWIALMIISVAIEFSVSAVVFVNTHGTHQCTASEISQQREFVWRMNASSPIETGYFPNCYLTKPDSLSDFRSGIAGMSLGTRISLVIFLLTFVWLGAFVIDVLVNTLIGMISLAEAGAWYLSELMTKGEDNA